MQFIDLKAQQERIRPALDAAIKNVLDHGKYIMGPEVHELEKQLADYVDCKHAIGCSSGTDALLIPLMAYGVGPGDAVFTTPFTFFATAEMIALTGATPVFVDIEPDTYNIDPVKLEEAIEKIKAEGKLIPRGIIPVDLFGLAADYDRIMPIADKHDLFVIEDAAQSFGAEYKGRKAPNLAHVGTTSFFPAKPLGGYGDGGAIFTNDDELAEKMRSILVHGKGTDKYNNVRIGINGRLDTIQAAILIEKLKLYPEEVELRQKVATKYSDALKNKFITPVVADQYKSVWAQYCIQSDDREATMARLKENDIPSMIYYVKPMHLLDAFNDLGYSEGDFPVSEAVSEKIFALPMHPYLSDEDQQKVIKTLLSTD